MMENGKRTSIHQRMRNSIDYIQILYDLYTDKLRGLTTNEKSCSSSATQTHLGSLFEPKRPHLQKENKKSEIKNKKKK